MRFGKCGGFFGGKKIAHWRLVTLADSVQRDCECGHGGEGDMITNLALLTSFEDSRC